MKICDRPTHRSSLHCSFLLFCVFSFYSLWPRHRRKTYVVSNFFSVMFILTSTIPWWISRTTYLPQNIRDLSQLPFNISLLHFWTLVPNQEARPLDFSPAQYLHEPQFRISLSERQILISSITLLLIKTSEVRNPEKSCPWSTFCNCSASYVVQSQNCDVRKI